MPCRTGTFAYLHPTTHSVSRKIRARARFGALTRLAEYGLRAYQPVSVAFLARLWDILRPAFAMQCRPGFAAPSNTNCAIPPEHLKNPGGNPARVRDRNVSL